MKKTIIVLLTLMLVFLSGLSYSRSLFASGDDSKKLEVVRKDDSQKEEQKIEEEKLLSEENILEGLPPEVYESPEEETDPKQEKKH